MGTDAAIFAVRAKRYFYYDRDYNLMSAQHSDAIETALTALQDHRPIQAHDVRAVLVAHDDLYESAAKGVERLGHHLGWRLAILRFVDAHPDDTFIRHTDSAEPSWHDMAEQGGYTEWKDTP